MYFYLAMVGFEPTPTSTAAPSNTETTVIPSQPLHSLKKELYIYIYISIDAFLFLCIFMLFCPFKKLVRSAIYCVYKVNFG